MRWLTRFDAYPWWVRSCTVGALLVTAFPPYPFLFAFLAFPALFLLSRLVEQAASPRQAMWHAYPGLLLWNLGTTYWLAFATVGGGVAAVTANAAVMTLPLGLYRYLRRPEHGPWTSALLFAGTWLSYEWFHHRWDLAWPWLTLGNAFSNLTLLVQYAEWTGVLGISAWVLMGARLMPAAQTRWGQALFYFPMILSFLLWGVRSQPVAEGSVRAAVVQPNFDSYQPLSGFETESDALETLLAIADPVMDGRVDLVLYPENAFEGRLRAAAGAWPNPRISAVAARWEALVVGGGSFVARHDPERAPFPARTDAEGPYDIWNAALGYDAEGGAPVVYGKRNLVPLVERMPFAPVMAYLLPDEVMAAWMGFGIGTEAVQFDVDGTRFPALICYDSVFPDWVRRQTADGAGFLSVITNDGWWGDTPGHEQHFAFARLRAIENRRAVVRSANNGISGLILPSGEVAWRTTYWTRDVRVTDIPIHAGTTLYVRFGDWIVWLVAALALWRRFSSGSTR